MKWRDGRMSAPTSQHSKHMGQQTPSNFNLVFPPHLTSLSLFFYPAYKKKHLVGGIRGIRGYTVFSNKAAHCNSYSLSFFWPLATHLRDGQHCRCAELHKSVLIHFIRMSMNFTGWTGPLQLGGIKHRHTLGIGHIRLIGGHG